MKVNVILIVLMVLMITSCSPRKDEKVATSKARIQRISLDEAAQYISNFLVHDQFGKIAVSQAIGGSFDVKVFETPADRQGVLFWYCVSDASSYPAFFLGMEHVAKYDTTNVPKVPVDELRVPETFLYTGGGTSLDEVKEFLITQTKPVQPTGGTLKVDEAKLFIQNFKDLVDSVGNCDLDNCKYPQGFFDSKSNDDMTAFLSHKPITVRYYFGYDTSYKPNAIRIILIGANEAGENIILATRDEGTILQKSFPPPPIL
ncbi:MAG: hypothetical protein KF856_03910 [Cyclobacteriaceae bacterium]|nr:hypothetical protein [Cyclobacteriaceae bacterium]